MWRFLRTWLWMELCREVTKYYIHRWARAVATQNTARQKMYYWSDRLRAAIRATEGQ